VGVAAGVDVGVGVAVALAVAVGLADGVQATARRNREPRMRIAPLRCMVAYFQHDRAPMKKGLPGYTGRPVRKDKSHRYPVYLML